MIRKNIQTHLSYFILTICFIFITQYSVYLSFNSTLQLINDISSDLQRLLKCINETAIVAFLKIPFAPSASVLPNNLDLYAKDIKSTSLAISALKLVASSLE